MRSTRLVDKFVISLMFRKQLKKRQWHHQHKPPIILTMTPVLVSTRIAFNMRFPFNYILITVVLFYDLHRANIDGHV